MRYYSRGVICCHRILRHKLHRQTWPVSQHMFHTTPRRSTVTLLLALKAAALVSGRLCRKWWQKLPTYRQWRYLILTSSATLCTFCVYYTYHIEETPITGRHRFIAFTPQQYQKISEASYYKVLYKYEDYCFEDDHPYSHRLNKVLNNLINANKDLLEICGHREWTTGVINSPSINAFSTDHGLILMNSGTIEAITTDDELAFVLAHEMAHILLSHTKEKISQARMIDFIIIAGMAAIWTIIPSDGISIVTQWFFSKSTDLFLQLPNSRKMEKEADKVGLEIMSKACYDVRAAPLFLTKMSIEQYMKENTALPEVHMEFLRTHPLSLKRARHMKHLLPKAEHLRNTRNCPSLPSQDPGEIIAAMSYLAEQAYIRNQTKANLEKYRQHPKHYYKPPLFT